VVVLGCLHLLFSFSDIMNRRLCVHHSKPQAAKAAVTVFKNMPTYFVFISDFKKRRFCFFSTGISRKKT